MEHNLHHTLGFLPIELIEAISNTRHAYVGNNIGLCMKFQRQQRSSQSLVCKFVKVACFRYLMVDKSLGVFDNLRPGDFSPGSVWFRFSQRKMLFHFAGCSCGHFEVCLNTRCHGRIAVQKVSAFL